MHIYLSRLFQAQPLESLQKRHAQLHHGIIRQDIVQVTPVLAIEHDEQLSAFVTPGRVVIAFVFPSRLSPGEASLVVGPLAADSIGYSVTVVGAGMGTIQCSFIALYPYS